ncbi:baseplate assembly protein [Altererythrobacter xixiisoli]|uniref:Baseplate assembly protein n=1 Tax=Croceibacterium xixiisoli TaxID=1476466 RepID=A0A6I4TYT6_9SPHN|nr:baseplate J/gp47 family protein [Croceibacterium xixiisoli]MXP00461.1 baseplate assembly protein [Croceibacterium xixiisoli]
MADATFTAVDLSRLAPPDIVERLDFETAYAQAVARFKAAYPDHVLRDSDPAAKVLQDIAYRAMHQRQRVNDATRAVMPAFAVGADLDHIAAIVGVRRLTITPADPANGTPAIMESDDDLRRRMVLAPEGYSVAGPRGAYVSHALSADADVLDADAYGPKPADIRALVMAILADHGADTALTQAMATALDAADWPGDVIISLLARSGTGEASPALTDRIEAYLSDETRRPLTDHVIVRSAEIIDYAIEATISTFTGPDAAIVLDAARRRIEAYVADSHRLGRDITRSGIFAALHTEGVHQVVLHTPADDIIIARHQAPNCNGIMLTHTGVGE